LTHTSLQPAGSHVTLVTPLQWNEPTQLHGADTIDLPLIHVPVRNMAMVDYTAEEALWISSYH